MAGTARVTGAYIDVRPELASDFDRTIIRAFSRVFDRVEDMARQSAQRMSDRFDDQFQNGARGLSTGVDRYWRDAEGRLRDGLGRFVADANDAGGDAGAGLTDGMADGIEGGQAGPHAAALAIGAGLVGAVAAAGAKAGAEFMEQLGNAMEREKSLDRLAARIGAFDETYASDLGAVAAKVYAGGWGENIGEVHEVMAEVFQQGLIPEDFADADLELLTTRLLDFAGIFEVDTNMLGQAVGQMLRNDLVPNAEAAFDVLARGYQQGADKAGDLLETFQEYGTQFRDLGLDAETATGLMVQGLQAGARDSDFVVDALKELSIRGKDASASSAEAFQALGLNADEMTRKFAEGGPALSEATDLVLDRLRAMEDPVAQNAAAVGLFGTKAEDLGDALFALDPSEAVKGLGDIGGAAQETSDVFNDNTATWWETIKRGFAKPFTDWFDNTLNPLMRDIATAFAEDGFGGIADKLREKWPEMKAGLTEWWNGVVEWAKEEGPGIIKGLVEGVGAAVEAGVGLWEKFWPALESFLADFAVWFEETAWPFIKEHAPGWLESFVDWAWDMFQRIAEPFGNFLIQVGKWIIDTGIPRMWEEGKKLAGALFEWISGDGKDWALDQLKLAVLWVLVWLKEDAPGLIATAAEGLWDGIVSAMKLAVNAVIDLWNKIDLEIPDIPGTDWGGIDDVFPDAPKLHDGGIFRAPPGQTEGLALLRDNETVFTPEQMSAYVNEGPARGVVVNQTINGNELSAANIAELSNRRLGRALALHR